MQYSHTFTINFLQITLKTTYFNILMLLYYINNIAQAFQTGNNLNKKGPYSFCFIWEDHLPKKITELFDQPLWLCFLTH